MARKSMELRYPMRGVVRRNALRATPRGGGVWPAPWAVNCRIECNIDRRMRGGSRPGLTKYVSDDMGTTIADIASVNTASASGVSDILFVLVDSTVKKVEGGTTSTPIAYLVDGSGDTVRDASGNDIIVSSGTAPSSGFLVVGQQHVFAVTTAAIVKMDPKTGQVDTLAASAGTIPTSCTFGAIYRDRMVLSGEDNAIYMSKIGDYTNWDFGQQFEDSSRAWAFQLALSNEVGAAPTALIPHKDTNLLAASQRSLWVVAGDPGADGSLRRVSENIGIISSRAWCKIEDTICFLGTDGLYLVEANGSNLRPISETVIPEELRDINTSTVKVSMGYEHDRRSVHIFLRTAGGNDTHWTYELGTESFWPVRMPNNHSPLVACQHDGEVLLAGNDGYIRKLGGDSDDGTNIESHVVIGPVRLGPSNQFGRLTHLHGMIAAGSGTVNWRIVTGDTAESASDDVKTAIETFQAGGDYSSYVQASGEWTAGRANMSYPRTRAVWACLWLQSTAKWAYEGSFAESISSGKWRGA